MQSFPMVFACRLFAATVLVAGLAACDSMPTKGTGYAAVLGAAEAEVSAGRVESALVGFNEAAKADPTSKEPWVRTAQLQFDAGNYGRAIVAAEEVLQRDPTDMVADSVLTVSGLRIASQALQRLQGNGALASHTARTEAERLAATMRATMGEDILDSGDAGDRKTRATASRRRAVPRPATAPTAATKAPTAETPAPQRRAIANPFGGMGN
ncbi:hypothetical protein H2514_12640 [Lysobacter sp. CW239]|jgi:predicted Zn-dependent protease|nr:MULTISPECIES: hypothetical protein [Lysobacter]QOD90989.1 hypothetical protein H2514_12640 [Lysobacter sp. CW239]